MILHDKENQEQTLAAALHAERHKRASLLEYTRKLRSQKQALLKQLHNLEQELSQRTTELKEARHNLGKIHSDMDDELEMAKQIQEGLVPKEFPDMVNVKSAAVYIPTGKVGGDLYDIIITPRQKIAVLIFDVSGHGVPAALIGAMAKMLFAHYIEKTESPADVFRGVNMQLCRFIQTEQYLTAFLGIIDPIKNCMVFSRAGHVPPLVYNTRSGSVTRLDGKGFFIGHSALLNLAEYWEQTIALEPDDKILFYTDGLTEGCSPDGKLYGGERLKAAFASCAHLELNEILDTIIENQIQFCNGAPLRDDFTLLCIEIGDSDYLLADSGFTRADEPNIIIVNQLEDIEKVCAIILKEMDRNGFGDKTIKQFKICIFEMITNAILHGNCGDKGKRVIVFYVVNRNAAAISVIDEGVGYDYTCIPDPILPENRMKDHGRGLYLIHHYLDEVELNSKGNRILGRKYHSRK